MAVIWAVTIEPAAMRQPAANPATLKLAPDGALTVAFAPAAGTDLAMLCRAGIVRGYASAATLRARVLLQCASNSGNHALAIAIAALKPDAALTGEPAFATAVPFGVTTLPGVANSLQAVEVAIAAVNRDGLADGHELAVRLARLNTGSSYATNDVLVRSIDLRLEI